MNQIQKNFCMNLKAEIGKQDLSVYDLAEKLAVAPSTIYNMMSFKRGASIEMADRLSQALKIPLAEMLKPQIKRSEINVISAKRLADLYGGGRRLYDVFYDFFGDDTIDMEDAEVIQTLNWFLGQVGKEGSNVKSDKI